MDNDDMSDALRQQSDPMTAQAGKAERWSSSAMRQVWPGVLAAALMLWMGLVALRGTLLVAQSFDLPIGGEPSQGVFLHQMLGAAVLVVLFCVIVALTARRFRPAATLPVTCAAGGLVLLAAAVGTGSLGPLLVVLAMFVVAWVVGHGVLCRLPSPPAHPIVSLAVAIALGLGIVGLLLLLLASLGWLNAAAVLALAVTVLASVLLPDRWRLAADAVHLRAWRPETPSWFETIAIGLAVGSLSFAMLSAIVPENDSDASRDHLPLVREIWQSGAVGEFPPFGISRDPVQAHLLYAVAYGLAGEGYAGIAAAKLLHAGVGLSALIGVAGLGWLCSCRLAAVVGAALLATTPLILWGVGHPPLDLFPVLFTVVAVLCLIHWQWIGAPAWLVVAGALAGFGFVAKITMAWVMVALAVGIFLVGRKPWQIWERVIAVLAFGLGTAVVVPWLVRTYGITGTLPGLDVALGLFTSSLAKLGVVGIEHIPPTAGAMPPSDVGTSHSLIELVQMPWLLTFNANQLRFTTLVISPIGIAPLLLLPLALLGPRTRAVAILAVTAAISYVAWWVTPLQVVRHLLPTLAIVAILAGVGVASTLARSASGLRRPLGAAARASVLVGLVAGVLLFIPEEDLGISIDRVTGRETAAEYVNREIPGAAILAAATNALPPDTRVGYVGAGEYARIYTEVWLLKLPLDIVSPRSSETAPAEVLANLDRLGIDYVMWDRERTRSEDWHSTLLSTDFLREHSRILAGDSNGYLFEVLPDGSKSWGEKRPRNLLEDPDLDKVKSKRSPWTIVGKVKARNGRVSMRDESAIAQQVPVSAGSPYLLSASATCPRHTERAELRIRWFDDAGVAIGTTAESVVPGTEGSEQFLWRRAPDQAVSVSAELTSKRCVFDEAALYQLS